MHNKFQTWGEFLEFATESKPAGSYRKSRKKGREEFAGTSTFEETVQLAVNGWPEGEAQAKRLADAIFAKVASLVEREEVVHDVVGAAIDIGAYLNGDPECWTRQESHITDGNAPKIFRIVYNCSASAGVDKTVLSAKGAAIAALVRALEFAGHRAEVWSIPICVSDEYEKRDSANPAHETRVQVKAADQDLDFGRLVFALAHPSMLRRLGFACIETDRIMVEKELSNYGWPCDSRMEDRGDIYIAKSFYGEPHWQNAESVIAWILQTLKTQGVSVRQE